MRFEGAERGFDPGGRADVGRGVVGGVDADEVIEEKRRDGFRSGAAGGWGGRIAGGRIRGDAQKRDVDPSSPGFGAGCLLHGNRRHLDAFRHGVDEELGQRLFDRRKGGHGENE